MARAGLSEHTIALIARWGSAAVLTYIRKAPLAASHHLAAVALAGWERGAATTRTPAPFTRTSVSTSGPSRAGLLELVNDMQALERRVTATEKQLRELGELRELVTTAAPLENVTPAVPPPDDIPDHWLAVAQAFPYVSSAFDKVHRVVVGYPEHPRLWRTQCGWPFGLSDVAVPAVSMPRGHVSMCERCFRVERRVAKAEAAIRVSEVGVD